MSESGPPPIRPSKGVSELVLHDGPRTRVVRRFDAASGLPVVVKSLRATHPTPVEIGRLRREHDLLEQLDGQGAPRVVRFEAGEVVRLVTEDRGATALRDHLDEVRTSGVRALQVAVGIARSLAAVHARGILHRDVNPSNIVVDLSGADSESEAIADRVWLIDFDLGSQVVARHADPNQLALVGGTPAYFAPEQTGRMNRTVDARSDLYSLGMTLYELFGGQRAFTRSDVLGYAHAHLAVEPPRLEPVVAGLSDDVAAGLVALVHTLVAKAPEARYQTARGVRIDLERLLDAAREGVAFEGLRGRAVGDRPDLPQTLVGREAEFDALLVAFDAVRQGACRVVAVTGESGIGKSALVRELLRPVTIAGGRLLAGKFDLYARDEPYAALGQVLQALSADLLTESTRDVESWRTRLSEAAGPNVRVLVDLAPDLAVLLGPPSGLPPLEPLDPAESERRLHETVRRALAAVASVESPLVVFLDDLQWADLASLRVLESLFRDPNLSHLLLVLSWRSEEVGADHAVGPTVEAIRATRIAVTPVQLGPLARNDVAALLGRALQREPSDLEPLVEVLYTQTLGNPFFLRRLVEEAGERGAIRFDADALRWDWSVDALEALGVADNVVALLRSQLDALPEVTRELLAAAALVPEHFDVEVLVLATGRSDAEVRSGLVPAVDGRFVVPLDDDWWGDGQSRNFRFQFVHDRLHEAAGALLSDREALAVHRRLGRALAATPELARSPFQAAEHLCTVVEADGHEALSDADRALFVSLATQAGERALQAAAADIAHRFLSLAVAAAGESAWVQEGSVARARVTLAARAAWWSHHADAFDAHIASLRAHSEGVLDGLRADELVLQARIASGELTAALDRAVEVLGEVGVALPRKPTQDDVMAAVGEALQSVQGQTLESLSERTTDRDPVERATRRFLVRVASAAYVAEPNLLPLVACELVHRSIERGVSGESAYGFGVFSLCLSAGWLLEAAAGQGELALGLMRRFPDRALEGAVQHVVHHFTRVWAEPLRTIYDETRTVYRSLMDVGDLEYAGWVLHMRVIYGFFSGVELPDLVEETGRTLDRMRLHEMDAARACTEQYDVLVRGWMGLEDGPADPALLQSPTYDADALFSVYVEMDFRAAVLALSVARLASAVFGGSPEAARFARDCLTFQDGALAIFYQAPMRVYATIALLDEVHPIGAPADATVDPAALAGVLETVDALAPALEVTAARIPANGAHLLALYEAEVARVRGDLALAIPRYDQAIDAALEAGVRHVAALASERAGRFHLARGASRIARIYLQDARHQWLRWGATARVAQLDSELGAWVRPVDAPRFDDEDLGTVSDPARPHARTHHTQGIQAATVSGTQHSGGLHGMDFESVLQASVAIASEVELDALVTRSMSILVENVGARRGVLLLAHRGELYVEAVAEAPAFEGQAPRVERLDRAPLDSVDTVDALAQTLIRRVWRSGQAETHDDATQRRAAASGTLDAGPGRSVLVSRIDHQGRPLGVLYFDNDLTTGAFTRGRVRILEALAPQVAVSVRNVRLQAAQNRFVPHQFLRSLERHDILDVEVGDHKLEEVSVFFSDVWGFTPLIEALSAEEALGFINRYLSFAEPAITGSGGFIDTYLGDGIMALFDEPGRSADAAVTGAVAMHHALDRFNVEREAAGLLQVRTGVGINTGTVTMATIGGQRSLKCGVVGDPVNLAARVEQLTRRTGSRLLISDDTQERLTSDVAVRRAGVVRVKGRVTPLTVWEVLDAELPEVQAARTPVLTDWEQAVDAYLAGDAHAAVAGFAHCLAVSREAGVPDLAAERYLALAHALGDLAEQGGIPDDWDGIENLTRKR